MTERMTSFLVSMADGTCEARPEVLDRLAWTLVHFLWEGVAIGAAAWVVLVLMRRASSGARYCVAWGAMLLMVVAPVVTFLKLTPPPYRVGKASVPGVVGVPAVVTTGEVPFPMTLAVAPLSVSGMIESEVARKNERFLAVLVWTWAGGVAALAAWRLAGWLHLRRMVRRRTSPVSGAWVERLEGLKAKLKVTAPVRLLEAAWVQVPSIVGCFKPVVLLPVGAVSLLPTGQVEALIAHELAHVRRRDYLINLVQCLVETVLFYHPAVWWISGVVRVERENCCDDLAAEACGDRVTYAKALAGMEELRGLPGHLALAARGYGSLVGRVRRVLGMPVVRERLGARSVLGVVVAVACVVMPLVAARVEAQGKDETKPEAAEKKETGTGEKKESSGAGTLKTTPVKEEDLIAPAGEYVIAAGDLLSFSIFDLTGPGQEFTRQMRVGDAGTILVPHLKPVQAAGKTEEQLRNALVQQYQKEGVIQNAQVSVALVESRGRVFNVLGDAVGKPGQYAISQPDFRLLDALAMSGTGGGEVGTIRVIRLGPRTPGKAPEQPRIIEVQPAPLMEGDVRQNLVVRPGDVITVSKKKLVQRKGDARLLRLELEQAVAKRDALREVLSRQKAQFGEQHPQVRQTQEELKTREVQIEVLKQLLEGGESGRQE